MNKSDKPLARLIMKKKKREKAQITNFTEMSNEKLLQILQILKDGQ